MYKARVQKPVYKALVQKLVYKALCKARLQSPRAKPVYKARVQTRVQSPCTKLRACVNQTAAAFRGVPADSPEPWALAARFAPHERRPASLEGPGLRDEHPEACARGS